MLLHRSILRSVLIAITLHWNSDSLSLKISSKKELYGFPGILPAKYLAYFGRSPFSKHSLVSNVRYTYTFCSFSSFTDSKCLDHIPIIADSAIWLFKPKAKTITYELDEIATLSIY